MVQLAVSSTLLPTPPPPSSMLLLIAEMKIPPPMDRRAASYVKEQLVYNQIKPEDAAPPPSLSTTQGSRDPFQRDEVGTECVARVAIDRSLAARAAIGRGRGRCRWCLVCQCACLCDANQLCLLIIVFRKGLFGQ